MVLDNYCFLIKVNFMENFMMIKFMEKEDGEEMENKIFKQYGNVI